MMGQRMNEQLVGRYHGTWKPLFWLVLKTSFLTLITLGIYRFWAKTRIRKYIWSATSGGKDSFEYTGTGLEKFLGFLVAIVVLAIYLGIIQMLLLFFGLSLMVDATTTAGQAAQAVAINITVFAVLPLILFAQYRARRYKMSRTRWRGVRFGMAGAAWGYVLRAVGHTLLTIITLGILLPRQTFYLEKYMADRTWYGNAQFEQGGRWQALYRGLIHIPIAVAIFVAGGLMAANGSEHIGIGFIFVGYIWLVLGAVYYRIYSFNYLTGNKILDGQIGFFSGAAMGKVVGIIIKGAIIIGILALVIFGVFGLISTSLFYFSIAQTPQELFSPIIVILVLVGIVVDIALLLAIRALSFALITQPVIDHVVCNVALSGAQHLDAIQQRASDTGADAEGFADALDIGGAI